jgi:hypothetical protein
MTLVVGPGSAVHGKSTPSELDAFAEFIDGIDALPAKQKVMSLVPWPLHVANPGVCSPRSRIEVNLSGNA